MDFILTRFGERTLVNSSGELTRFGDLGVDRKFLGIGPARVHLAGITLQARIFLLYSYERLCEFQVCSHPTFWSVKQGRPAKPVV